MSIARGLGLRAAAVAGILAGILVGCSQPGGSTAPSSTLPASASPTAAASTAESPKPSGTPPPFNVATSLDGLSSLPHRIHWEVTPGLPSSDVSEVDYLIDGELAWVEYKVPYFYGDDGNWLVTSFLTAGLHTFTARVVTLDGQTVIDEVSASVASAPDPPPSVAGEWTRVITAGDLAGLPEGDWPPAGRWVLRIDAVGWEVSDPTQGGIPFDVAYPGSGRAELGAAIEQPPLEDPFGGGFCDEPDVPFVWVYSVGGGALDLHPDGADPCPYRVSILKGRWDSVGG